MLSLTISSSFIYGQSEKIDEYFKTEVPILLMDFGELTYTELVDVIGPDSTVFELSNELNFYYARIRADQFGMPIVLSMPIIIDGEKIAVFIPQDDSKVSSFIKLLSQNMNSSLDKEAIAERLFIFLREVLLENRTAELANFELERTNTKTVLDGENINVIEIGLFKGYSGTEKMHQTRKLTVLFSENELKGIK